MAEIELYSSYFFNFRRVSALQDEYFFCPGAKLILNWNKTAKPFSVLSQP